MAKQLKMCVCTIILCMYTFCAFAIEDEEYEVYSTVLENISEDYNTLVDTFVVNEKTTDKYKLSGDTVKYFEDNNPVTLKEQFTLVLGKDLIKNYNAKNNNEYILENKFTTSQKIVLITEKEINSIFSNDAGWDNFYRMYPNSTGTVEFSRVGFNPERTRAFVCFGNRSHWFMGAGYYVLLSKSSGRWEVETFVPAWKS